MTSEPGSTPDSVSERLIAALEAEANFVDQGQFSVDLDRAGAKLGQFALADPDAWTLLLVELASLLDATRIDFRYELRGLTVSIEPSVLMRSDLDGLSAWALADDGEQDDRRRRARKQLALVYLALRAREVARITIVGVPTDEPAFVLDCVESKERIGSIDAGFDPGMHFMVLFGLGDPERMQRERELIEARCNCSRVPVHIDGFRIAKGWSRIFGNPFLATPKQLAARIELPITRDGETIGVAGFHLEQVDRAFMRVLVNGVLVEDVQLDANAGFRALVETDLRRDLSQGKVVRDDRFEAIVAAVAEAHLAACELHPSHTGLGAAARGLVVAEPVPVEDEPVPVAAELVPVAAEPGPLEPEPGPVEPQSTGMAWLLPIPVMCGVLIGAAFSSFLVGLGVGAVALVASFQLAHRQKKPRQQKKP
jgi:hypothetical protein